VHSPFKFQSAKEDSNCMANLFYNCGIWSFFLWQFLKPCPKLKSTHIRYRPSKEILVHLESQHVRQKIYSTKDASVLSVRRYNTMQSSFTFDSLISHLYTQTIWTQSKLTSYFSHMHTLILSYRKCMLFSYAKEIQSNISHIKWFLE